MKHDYHQRREKRIANAKNRALINEQEAESLYSSAKEMASHIPFGQPILVGHHSEKKDRNYRDKIHDKFGKSFEKMEKAKYYTEKAETIESYDAISSDDPQALQKLEQKLKSLQEAQEFMKSANKCIKKKDMESFLKLPHTSLKIWEDLNKPDFTGCRGFARYSLTNNGANIRQVQNRIGKLKKLSERQSVDKVINGVRIFENREANRLQVIFKGKPEAETIKKLKSCGFRWAPSENAWQRHISNTAFHLAKQIAEALVD